MLFIRQWLGKILKLRTVPRAGFKGFQGKQKHFKGFQGLIQGPIKFKGNSRVFKGSRARLATMIIYMMN